MIRDTDKVTTGTYRCDTVVEERRFPLVLVPVSHRNVRTFT